MNVNFPIESPSDSFHLEGLSLTPIKKDTLDDSLAFLMTRSREPSAPLEDHQIKSLEIPKGIFSELSDKVKRLLREHRIDLLQFVKNKGIDLQFNGKEHEIRIKKREEFEEKITEITSSLENEDVKDFVIQRCLKKLWPTLCLIADLKDLSETGNLVDAPMDDISPKMSMQVKDAVTVTSLFLERIGGQESPGNKEIKQQVREIEQLLAQVKQQQVGSSAEVIQPASQDIQAYEKIKELHTRTMEWPKSLSFCGKSAATKLIESEQARIVAREFINHIKPNNNWLRYIINRPDFTKCYSANQELFGSLMANFSELIGKKISEGMEFQAIMDIACYGRFLMSGNENSHWDAEKYGLQRMELPANSINQHVLTVLTNSYKELGEYLQAQARVWMNHNSPLMAIRIFGEDADILYFTMHRDEYGEVLIPLSKVMCGKIYHTQPNHLKTVMNQVEALFKEALQLNLDETQLYEKLGQFFFLFCQAKPVLRGDPSIAEMLFKGVLAYRGLDIPGWKPGVIPWEETMKEYDPMEFGKKFSSFFAFPS